MKRLGTLAITFWAIVNSGGATAETWGNWQVAGNCNRANTQLIANGESLSVVFSDFGVNLEAGRTGEGLSAEKTCLFRIILDPPPGMFVAGFSQLYQGGVIKSAQTAGDLQIHYHVGPWIVNMAPHLTWLKGSAITPEDPRAFFSQSYEDEVPKGKCRDRVLYGVGMTFRGFRANYQQHFIGGVDSLDATYTHRVQITPRYKPCK